MNDIYNHNHAKQNEVWTQLGAINRAAYLRAASSSLAELCNDSQKAQRLFDHVISQAARLDKVLHLDGATGESNDLYFSGRGKTMIVGTDNAQEIPVIGQLLAGLLAGNEVILHYPSQQQLCEQVIDILTNAGVLSEVMSIANDSQLTTLLHINRLAVVGAVGTYDEIVEIGQTLATTEGILTQLVAVMDQEGCHEMFEPEYTERFATERVKTINTTAIGGNASLLELSMDD